MWIVNFKRNVIKRIWPFQLPDMEPETLARLVFCFENSPERSDGIISGAQDSIGICVPGLCRHYYDNHFWPEKIETCTDENVRSVRPGYGLHPKYLSELIGRKVNRDLEVGDRMSWEVVK